MRINAINQKIFTNAVSKFQNINSNYCFQDYRNDVFEKTNPYNTVSFTGVDGNGKVKQRGMLFHISSLPATRSCCGQFLDPQTVKFMDFLHKSKQTHWIMNPLFALGDDLCPYYAFGRFSKNKYLVNLNEFTKDEYGKLLKPSELPDDVSAPVFTMEMLKSQKDPRFEKAYERFLKLDPSHPLKQEYKGFEKENNDLWLDTYANYSGIASVYGDNWREWPVKLQTLPEDAKIQGKPLKDALKAELNHEIKNKTALKSVMKNIGLFKFEQFMYNKQFNEFKKQLDERNLNLILDLAIGVSPNGVDVWANKNIFLLDKKHNPTKVSGCPPESAYPRTQVWGHALYDYDSPDFWDYQESSLRKLLQEGDLRLDHFVGYINRAEIPTTFNAPDGRTLKGDEIFAPKEQGGMGKNFFRPEWVVRTDKKTNVYGENMFELFKRVAREEGKNPEDCFILEDFGPLAETEAYKEFKNNFGNDFVSQRIPVAMGIGENIKKAQKPNISSPQNLKNQNNIALLTGNHDLPPLREYIDLLLDNKPKRIMNFVDPKLNGYNSPALFKHFCKTELKLTDEEMKDRDVVLKELMKWHYTRDNVKQVQTTLQDALGLYYRPNIPGYYNGMEDKYKMKTTPEALLPFWSRVFPRDFLDRSNKSGINPGYKDLADNYIKMMDDLYSIENI